MLNQQQIITSLYKTGSALQFKGQCFLRSPLLNPKAVIFTELVCTDELLLDYLLDLRNPYLPEKRENPISNPTTIDYGYLLDFRNNI
jgi:hypothetical protein